MNRSGCRANSPSVRARIARQRCNGRRHAGVTIGDCIEQDDDRIAARDKMVVCDAEKERVALIDREKSGMDRYGHRP
jgi:hypothetical protein